MTDPQLKSLGSYVSQKPHPNPYTLPQARSLTLPLTHCPRTYNQFSLDAHAGSFLYLPYECPLTRVNLP